MILHFIWKSLISLYRQPVKGRYLSINQAQRNKNLLVEKIPSDTNEDDLKEFLNRFGTISTMQFKKEEQRTFVEYTTRESAEKAKSKGGDQLFHGIKLQFSWADSQSLNNSLHIQFLLTPDTIMYTKQDLEEKIIERFTVFGKVIKVDIYKQMNAD